MILKMKVFIAMSVKELSYWKKKMVQFFINLRYCSKVNEAVFVPKSARNLNEEEAVRKPGNNVRIVVKNILL